jgi:hypothetical protein
VEINLIPYINDMCWCAMLLPLKWFKFKIFVIVAMGIPGVGLMYRDR